MATGGCISYWMLPVFSGLAWLATLLGLLLHWVVATGRRHYPDMAARASIVYISNVGAHELKPLFVAGAAVTAASLDLGLAADRWLRHRGRLVPRASPAEAVLAALTLAFVFTFYILSFAIDLAPAVRTKDPAARFDKPRDAEYAAAAANSASNLRDRRRSVMDPHPPNF